MKKNRRAAADHQAVLASSARLLSGAISTADAPSAIASAGGPSQSANATESATPSFLPLQNIMTTPNQLLVFTESCDIAISASASEANVSALAPWNSRPGDGLECLSANAAETNGADSDLGP